MNEATLIEKLIKIEALFAGAATEGERVSADRARQRILQRLAELIPEDPPVEYKKRIESIRPQDSAPSRLKMELHIWFC